MLQKMFYEDELQNPELMTFKIIDAKYIASTMSSGSIYLGCADYYAYQEIKTGNKGQGDVNEGLYARVRKNNSSYINEQERLHGSNLLKIANDGFWDLKLHSVINMPVFCFYTINAFDPGVRYFYEPSQSLRVRYRTYQFMVPQKVWQDFGSDNFSIIKFLNHTDLSSRIDLSLQAEGCQNTIKNRMKYVNRENKEWFCDEDHPAELFYKDASFSHQNEGRIIITDSKISFINEKDIDQKIRSLKIGNVMEIVEEKGIKVQDIRFKVTIRIEESHIP
jgi:hypothetical protein